MNDKVNAAKRLIAALNDPLDFELYLMDHPNTERAMSRLAEDVAECENPRKIGLYKQRARSERSSQNERSTDLHGNSNPN